MMETTNYNPAMLRQYLLGTLDASRTEEFDELSIADEGFADALSAAENELIDQFVAGTLGSEETRLAGKRFAASRRMRERVDFARALKEVGDRETDVQPTFEPVRRGILSALPRFATRWAFAALLVLIAAGGVLVWLSGSGPDRIVRNEDVPPPSPEDPMRVPAPVPSPRPTDAPEIAKETVPEPTATAPQALPTPKAKRPALAAIATFVLAPPVRGGIPTLRIRPGTSSILIRAELETGDFPRYRAILKDPDSGEVLSDAVLVKPRTSGGRSFLQLKYPARTLRNGVAAIEISGVSVDGKPEIIGDYTFRVVR